MGRPWPLPGEPLFTDEDTVEILDYLADEKLIHEPCGQPIAESFRPENEFAYRATALACHACAAKAREMKALDVTDGVYLVVERSS
jgi:hypothetical protein